MQNPYTSTWEAKAYEIGMEQFQLLCHRVAEETIPTPECEHSADEWEACLEAGCNMSPEQVALTHKLIVRYEKLADSSIREHMVEPEGSYFGTSSCFINAAVRGVQAIASKIKVEPEISKDRSIEVVERDGKYFLVTDEVPEGDQLISAHGMITDQEDSPYVTYLGVVRRDSEGWYRRTSDCDGCGGVGFEVVIDPICAVSDGSCTYLCGPCQYEADEDR